MYFLALHTIKGMPDKPRATRPLPLANRRLLPCSSTFGSGLLNASTTMRYFIFLLSLAVFPALMGCGGTESGPAPATPPPPASGLSSTQLENGVGPISTLELTPAIDAALAAQGEEIFTTKCSACHKFDIRYVGPPLGEVLATRSPAFVMNMMLNPAEMLEKHPEVKAMLAQFATPMPNQNLTQDDARAVLEYIRAHQNSAPNSAE